MPSKDQDALHIPLSHITTHPPESFSPLDTTIPQSNCTWHTLLSSPTTPTDSFCAGIAILPPKSGNLCPHRHTQSEIYHVLSGKAVVTVNGKEYRLEKGSTFWVPGDAEHGVVNEGEEEFRWFYAFATKGFDDVVYRWSDSSEGKFKAKL